MKYSDSQRPTSESPLVQKAFAQALETLNSLNEKRIKSQIAENDEIAKYTQALQAPFLEQISQNAQASSALEALRRHRVLEPADFHSSIPVREDRSGAPLFNLHLQEHLSVVGAPYDFDWQRGNPILGVGLHNRLNGMIGIRGGSGHVKDGSSGRVDAAAGIGLAITTDRPATVSVRPYISYTWQSGVVASGPFSSGETKGGLDAAAFLNGEIIDGVRRSELFSDSRSWSGTSQNDGNGVAWVPDLTLGFNITPGQVVVVNFGAWVQCDHSNGIGVGGGAGIVQAQVSWVVVERFL